VNTWGSNYLYPFYFLFVFIFNDVFMDVRICETGRSS